MKKWVLLDRDGVINEDSDDYIKSLDEWHVIPSSLEAIAKFHRAGFCVGVATNQSGIARGYYTTEVLNKIHANMTALVQQAGGLIQEIAYCPHGPDRQCDCRKPKPGLLQQIAEKHQFSLENVPFVGDSLRDLEAAQAVGALPILVKTGRGRSTLEKHAEKIKNILVFDNLLSFADYWIK